jgi:phosphoglycerol transferase MdoB-like AlkP superfamily enzyme
MEESERARWMYGLYSAVSAQTILPDGLYTGSLLTTRTPDVLLIIMESFGTSLMEYPDVAPNLNKLASEGVYFSNCYANSYRTDRGMVSLLSGQLSYPKLSLMKLPRESQSLPNLARTLSGAGYETSMLYGGDINFTNMKGYLRAGGYAHITADTDFPLQERTSSKWGVQDEHTFNYQLSIINCNAAANNSQFTIHNFGV